MRIIYEINLWDRGYDDYPTLENSFFGAVKLVKNIDYDKYKYSGYGIRFDRDRTFSVGNGFGKNAIIFEVDISSSIHVDINLSEGPTQGLDDTTLTAEKRYSVNFTEHNKKFCLSLHYNRAISYWFVSGVEIHKFKATDFEIVVIPLCLGNISKDFSVDDMKKTGLHG